MSINETELAPGFVLAHHDRDDCLVSKEAGCVVVADRNGDKTSIYNPGDRVFWTGEVVKQVYEDGDEFAVIAVSQIWGCKRSTK